MIEFGNALPHDIHIIGSANKGFIVKVGCSTSVFSDKEDMIHAIRKYINDPDKMEKLYNESNVPQEVEVTSSGGRTLRGPRVMATEECQNDCETGPDPAR